MDLNGTQAYKRAGYSAKTDDVAAVGVFKLLRNPKILHFIEELQEELRRKAELTAENIEVVWIAPQSCH
ncbi:terminase small subunit [Segetibacter koreensis]|uniref:terminase small subunit n=1 Tax=Segetibacter koreensis TaxID=398037 RepID=UPI000A01B044